MEVLNNTGSCCTYPIKFLKYSKSYSLISLPSIKTFPSVTSYNLSIKLIVVLFPHPVSPTKQLFVQVSMTKFKPSKIFFD